MKNNNFLKIFIFRILLLSFFMIIGLNILVGVEYKNEYNLLNEKIETEEDILNNKVNKIVEETIYDILFLLDINEIDKKIVKKYELENKFKRFLNIKNYYKRIIIYDSEGNKKIDLDNYGENMDYENDNYIIDKVRKNEVYIYPIKCNCNNELVFSVMIPIIKDNKHLGNIIFEVSIDKLVEDFKRKYNSNNELSVFVIRENKIVYEIKNSLNEEEFDKIFKDKIVFNDEIFKNFDIYHRYYNLKIRINNNLLIKIDENYEHDFYKKNINVIVFLSESYFKNLRKIAFENVIKKHWIFLILFIIIAVVISYIYSKNIIYRHKIEENASFDKLTGLYNRYIAMEFLEKYIKSFDRNIEKLTIIYLDANNLKKINDSFGHKKGDEMLKTISNAIRNGKRESDIASRIGGDEFLLILPNCDENEAKKVKLRIEKYLEEYSEKLPLGCKFSASMGIEEYRKYDTLESFISKADKKMYENKKNKVDFREF